MNWKETRKAYPKAEKELRKKFNCFINSNGWMVTQDRQGQQHIVETRRLYDHFDALGIVCSVETFTRRKVAQFEGRVKLVPNRGKHIRSLPFQTRIEAEEFAFTRAFALREGALNNQQ